MENNGNSVCQENSYTTCEKCAGHGTVEKFEDGKFVEDVACDCCGGSGKELWRGWSL